MQLYDTIHYRGEDWNYSWLDFNSKLSEDIARNVIWNVVDMYMSGKSRRNLGNRHYRAKIEHNGSRVIGFLGGEAFTADVEADGEKSRLAIMLLDFREKGTLH
jgi:hypothetical protein